MLFALLLFAVNISVQFSFNFTESRVLFASSTESFALDMFVLVPSKTVFLALLSQSRLRRRTQENKLKNREDIVIFSYHSCNKLKLHSRLDGLSVSGAFFIEIKGHLFS